jgi:type I restriction enzyme M protein
MLGAIIGDIAGSRFEWNNCRSKDFELLHEKCRFTDDTVMSLAVCDALLKTAADRSALGKQAVRSMQSIGRHYPDCGYGGRFGRWIFSDSPQPYGSFGNGAAMRSSACGWAGGSLDEVKDLARAVTEISHSHPEGLKGAEAEAVGVFLARTGASMQEIRRFITENYYKIDFTLDAIRDSYEFDETCQGSVPQAFEAFFESSDYEDAVRNAISIGGDSDTLAAIAGGVAEAFYGIPNCLREQAAACLDERLLKILRDFETVYPPRVLE